jgi:hypothetical protein
VITESANLLLLGVIVIAALQIRAARKAIRWAEEYQRNVAGARLLPDCFDEPS